MQIEIDKLEEKKLAKHLPQNFEHFNLEEWRERKNKFWHNFRTELNRRSQFQSNDGKQILTVKKNKISLKVAKGEEPNISALIDMAQDKGWTKLKIRYPLLVSNQIKAEIWYESKKRGLEIEGYKPSQADEQRLEAFFTKEREKQEQSSKDLEIKPPQQALEQSQEQKNAPLEKSQAQDKGAMQFSDMSEQLAASSFGCAEAHKILISAYEGLPQNTEQYQNAEKKVDEFLTAIYTNPTLKAQFTRQDALNMRNDTRSAMEKKMKEGLNAYAQNRAFSQGMLGGAQVKDAADQEQTLKEKDLLSQRQAEKTPRHNPPKRGR